MSLSNCEYTFNYGALGGVLSVYDYFDVSISDCTFTMNRGTKGGAIYISELSSNDDTSTITISDSQFLNQSVTS